MAENPDLEEALRRHFGGPEWLLSLAIETCGPLSMEFDLLDWVRRMCGGSLAPAAEPELRGLAAEYSKAVADPRARRRLEARADLKEGKFRRRVTGLLRGSPVICPRCVVCRFGPLPRPTQCADCGSPLVHVVSSGCIVCEETRSENSGYNAEVEKYIRETWNPKFSWGEVHWPT